MEKLLVNDAELCESKLVLALNDTLNVISGKWKLPIMASLLSGKKRFSEIERNIPTINPRMLSKELKELEINGIVARKVNDSKPVTVDYELTSSGYAIRPVLEVMINWGMEHRASIMGKK
ncbi:HxlR family transcriptional regulator [Chitinophaga skermanii]|uniref:HxlR family transcriptional regulator n=1 Tax=Chitinophaga skermanii TaxID=331697 RepID=A0A327QSQ5_9BACT|nr:helix-turn-helix domain-containing protein [Chitinophaga skermanii]RAJ06935.1 HxlR family transcriptional regulator [Chitinophaga skermanii]